MKAASQKLSLDGFPFAKLAFILRVDGEVNQYQMSGAGNLQIDPHGEYVSVDIGIMRDDRDRILEVICGAILSSAEQIKTLPTAAIGHVDFQSLKTCLSELIVRFNNELPCQLAK